MELSHDVFVMFKEYSSTTACWLLKLKDIDMPVSKYAWNNYQKPQLYFSIEFLSFKSSFSVLK